MPDLTVGEAREQLAQCRTFAQQLLAKLETLDRDGIVFDLRVGIGPLLSPPTLVHCLTPLRDYLVVGDYVMGLRGVVEWLSDVIESLDFPASRPFAEGRSSNG